MDYEKLVAELRDWLPPESEKIPYGELVGAPYPYNLQGPLVYADEVCNLVEEAADAITALSPPNEPLTQADLDSMDYDKVWIDYGDDGEWALVVSGRIYALAVLEGTGFEDILRDEVNGETMDRPSGDYTVYRRPPEGEDET